MCVGTLSFSLSFFSVPFTTFFPVRFDVFCSVFVTVHDATNCLFCFLTTSHNAFETEWLFGIFVVQQDANAFIQFVYIYINCGLFLFLSCVLLLYACFFMID